MATTGDPKRVLKLTVAGKILRTYRTKLPGNHLMEFAADLAHHRLFPIGPCEYAGGLSAINLSTGHTRVLVAPRKDRSATGQDRVCGARAQYLPGQQAVAIAANPAPDASGHEKAASLTFVDTRTGKTRQRIQLPAPTADLLAMSQPQLGSPAR